MRKEEKFVLVACDCETRVEYGVNSLLLRHPSNETVFVNPPQKVQRGLDSSVAAVCFEATYDCNLACRYCFMQNDESFSAKSGMMEISTAVAYLKKYCPSDKVSTVKISYMGGEPLLNMNLLVRVVDYCRKTYKKATFGMTTNGTRLGVMLCDAVTLNLNPQLKDLTIGEWLMRTGHSLTISMDGPKETHDRNRITKCGKGSFEATMKGLEGLADKHPNMKNRISFRATLSDGMEDCPLKERLIFFNELVTRGLGSSIHFEPVSVPGNKTGEALSQLKDQFKDAVDWVIEEVKTGRSPRWTDLIDRPFRRLVYRSPQLVSCGAGVGYMVCGVDGTIYACHRTEGSEVGSIKDGHDVERLHDWHDNTVFFQEPCATCDWRYLCGGSCRACNFTETGDLRKVSDFACGVRKLRMEAAVRLMVELTPEERERLAPRRMRKRPEEKTDSLTPAKNGGRVAKK